MTTITMGLAVNKSKDHLRIQQWLKERWGDCAVIVEVTEPLPPTGMFSYIVKIRGSRSSLAKIKKSVKAEFDLTILCYWC